MAEREERMSARVLLIDPDGRVLLMRVVDPTTPHIPPVWVTPGGGLEPGEDYATAAIRELHEETGLVIRIDDLIGPVAYTKGDWEFRGRPLSSEDYCYLYRCEAFEPVAHVLSEIELQLELQWRWLSCDDLDALEEIVFPERLVGLVRDIIAGATFDEPVHLPWTTA